MFLNESNDNIIKYIKVPNEKTDKFALSMINNGNIPNLIVCGENNIELLFPVSNLTPLKVYLRSCSFLDFLAILKDAVMSENIPNEYLLGNSHVVNQLSKSYVENGILKLICIPSDYASSYKINNADYLLEIICAWFNSNSNIEEVIELRNLIIGECSQEIILNKIDELMNSNNLEPKTNEPPTLEKIPKKKKKIRDWFFAKEHVSQVVYVDDLPKEISVISVRGENIEYPLAFGPDTIGTNENLCSIAFPKNNTLDDEHSRITFENGRYFIEDLDSTSGTFLNNERLEPRKKTLLTPADLIKVGSVELVFSRRT